MTLFPQTSLIVYVQNVVWEYKLKNYTVLESLNGSFFIFFPCNNAFFFLFKENSKQQTYMHMQLSKVSRESPAQISGASIYHLHLMGTEKVVLKISPTLFRSESQPGPLQEGIIDINYISFTLLSLFYLLLELILFKKKKMHQIYH